MLRQIIVLGATSLMVLACGRMPVEGEELAPEAPAMIERRVTAGEGLYDWWVEVDSAAARYRVRCQVRIPGATCSRLLFDREGALSPATVKRLFSDANSSEFRALRAEYDLSATYVDGPLYSITVTAGGRRRTIRWSDAAKLPAVLTRFSDMVLTSAELPLSASR